MIRQFTYNAYECPGQSSIYMNISIDIIMLLLIEVSRDILFLNTLIMNQILKGQTLPAISISCFIVCSGEPGTYQTLLESILPSYITAAVNKFHILFTT